MKFAGSRYVSHAHMRGTRCLSPKSPFRRYQPRHFITLPPHFYSPSFPCTMRSMAIVAFLNARPPHESAASK